MIPVWMVIVGSLICIGGGALIGFLVGVDAAGLAMAEEWQRRHPDEVDLTPGDRAVSVVFTWGRWIADLQAPRPPYRGRHRLAR